MDENDRRTRPASPCVSICMLDDANRCLGCGRTLQQIAGWARMSPAEQWGVVEEIRNAMPIALESAG